jgi:hypothetical protein
MRQPPNFASYFTEFANGAVVEGEEQRLLRGL